MKTNTRAKILALIQKGGSVRPHDLSQQCGITAAATHRHLLQLQKDSLVEKVGRAPHVFYKATSSVPSNKSQLTLSTAEEKILDKNYLYIDPSGNLKSGSQGFQDWLKSIKEEKRGQALVKEYIQGLRMTESFKSHDLIDATKRFDGIFKKLNLDQIYYQDFYSLPKFGKTKLGQLVLHGKQAQDKKIISKIAEECKAPLLQLIKSKKIQAVAWTPHSLPRKIPFLKELENNLKINLPRIDLIKAYSGAIPIAQKTLSKLDDRIANARDTILVKSMSLDFKRVLLIDDAVGSGATLNEAAARLKEKGIKEVIGFAIVGSFKGFEVIREI